MGVLMRFSFITIRDISDDSEVHRAGRALRKRYGAWQQKGRGAGQPRRGLKGLWMVLESGEFTQQK